MDMEIRNVNEKWKLFTLKNDNGMEVELLNYGGIITKIVTPDKNNHLNGSVAKF